MARFRDAKGRDRDSGYARTFGNQKLGLLFSRVHATLISSGTELEKIVTEQVKSVGDLDGFLEKEIMSEGVFLTTKKAIKQSEKLQFHGSEPDFLVFKRRDRRQHCYVIEMKDGDAFDTKKASAEHRSVHSFVSQNAAHLHFTVSVLFVAFNQTDRQVIYDGFKHKVPIAECMTGKEFCNLLEIDYEKTVAVRKKDCEMNFSDFVDALLGIEDVCKHLRKRGWRGEDGAT